MYTVKIIFVHFGYDKSNPSLASKGLKLVKRVVFMLMFMNYERTKNISKLYFSKKIVLHITAFF